MLKHPEYIDIGKRIAKVRLSKNITQEELAEMMDVSVKHISCVENAQSSFSLKQIIKFCDYFNCSLDYLVLGNMNNPALSILPEGIVDILCLERSAEKETLIRFLEMYLELTKQN